VRKLLREQFGAEVDLQFFTSGKGRIYVYRDSECPIKGKAGIYFGKMEKDGLRLSIEGSFIVGRVAKKSVLEIDQEKAMRWLAGEDIEANVEGFWILKWGQYFLGCGKGDGRVLRNYVPKDRRIRLD